MVLIFSTPKASHAASNVENRAFRSATSVGAGRRAEMRGEAHEVAEDDRDIVVAVGDEPLPGVEPVDDGLRQHVEQQLVRPPPLDLQVGHQAGPAAGRSCPGSAPAASGWPPAGGSGVPTAGSPCAGLRPDRRPGRIPAPHLRPSRAQQERHERLVEVAAVGRTPDRPDLAEAVHAGDRERRSELRRVPSPPPPGSATRAGTCAPRTRR